MRSALLLAFATAPLSACGEAPEDADPDVEEPPTARWMADVFADHRDVPVNRVLLPGAFNSTSYACDVTHGISPDAPALVASLWASDDPSTQQRVVDWARSQDLSIRAQLEAGSRFVEINVTTKDGELVVWHSVYGVPFAVVLDDLVAFVTTHPSEALVLTFGVDVFLEPDEWPLLADALTAPRADGASLCDLVDVDHENAALATLADLDASGRPIVWGVPGELGAFLATHGCPTSQVTVDRRWSITTTPEGVAAALADSVDGRDPEHLLINDFVFSLDGSATVGEQAGYVLRYSGVREASEALGFAGDFPGRLIEQFDAAGNLNVLAGAMIEDTNLVEAAIAANRARIAD